jgi:hypothetical protein
VSDAEATADDAVDDSVRLFRRITKHHLKAAADEPLGVRVTSAAFQPSSQDEGVSINLEDTMMKCEVSAEDLMDLPPEALGLSHVTAGQVRAPAIGKDVDRDPLPDDPSHGNIVGRDSTSRQRALAKLATAQWVIEPSAEVLAPFVS